MDEGTTVYTIKLVSYPDGSYGIKTRSKGDREERFLRDMSDNSTRWPYRDAVANLNTYLLQAMSYRFDRSVEE